MAEQPALYRIFRLGDAVTLGLVALALTTTTATAARTEVRSGADPSAAGKALAYQRADRSGVLRDGRPNLGPSRPGPGDRRALCGGDLRRGRDQDPESLHPAPDRLVRRPGRRGGGDLQGVAGLPDPQGRTLRAEGPAHQASRESRPAKAGRHRSSPAQIGHPSVDGGRVFYAVSKRRGSSIKRRNLKSGKGGTVVRSRTAALSNPSALGKRLLYVRASRARQGPQVTRAPKLRQSLMLKRIGRKGPGRRIYSRGERRQLWSTSLTAKRGFATLLGRGGPRIISVRR